MKSTALYLALTLLAASPVLICQTTTGGLFVIQPDRGRYAAACHGIEEV